MAELELTKLCLFAFYGVTRKFYNERKVMIDFSNDTVRPLGQYSKKFSVTKATIHRWKKEEGFPAFMLVGAWYSSDKAVCEWMAKQQQDGESRRGNKHWNKKTIGA